MGKKYVEAFYREFAGQGKKEIKTPDFFCASCEKRCDNWCSFFNRYIVKNYNRCYHHSFYSPVQATFKPAENLEEIIEKEEIKGAA